MNEIKIKWCPTKGMIADFMTKLLQGSPFKGLRDYIMGMTSIKRPKNPNLSSVTMIRRDGRVKVRRLERNQTARRPISPSSVGVLAQ
jgi:hypothetical protein